MDPSQYWRPRTEPVGQALGTHPLDELYDLEKDPWEMHNLADEPEYEGVRCALGQRLGEWMCATEDPLLRGAVTSPRHWQAMELVGVKSPAGGCDRRCSPLGGLLVD